MMLVLKKHWNANHAKDKAPILLSGYGCDFGIHGWFFLRPASVLYSISVVVLEN
jgi:hypothetical protein